MSAPKSKQKLNLNEVLAKVVGLIHRHQPGDLNYSRISQLTGVPRSTLYYYFGNTPEKLLEEAAKFGMRAFVQYYTLGDVERYKDWKSFQEQRLMDAIQLVKKYPWAPSLYFKYRNHAGNLGKLIRDTEDEYTQKIGEAWKKLTGAPADIHALRLSGYLKLGLLWGIASEIDKWNFDQDPARTKSWVAKMTDLVTVAMKTKF